MFKKLFFLLIALLLLLSQRNIVRADWMMNKSGDLVFVEKQVLGEKDEKKDEEKKEEKKSEEKKDEKKENVQEIKKTIDTKPIDVVKQEVKKAPAFIKTLKHDEIKEVKIEAEEGDGKLKLKIEGKKGKTTEHEQDEFEIETEDENEPVKVSSTEAEGELKIKKGTIEAKMKFPLSVDPVTKVMTVTTPAGARPVTILPDKAAEVITRLNLIDNASKEAKMELGTENNELVYKVEGKKDKKLFGILPVSLKRDVFVSAQTGNVVKTDQSFLSSILNFLSF